MVFAQIGALNVASQDAYKLVLQGEEELDIIFLYEFCIVLYY